MSFKVIERLSPDEKLGVVVTVDGRPQVIEYSDLPPELAGRARARRDGSSSGPGASPSTFSSGRSSSGLSASIGCRSIGRSRRCPMWMTSGRP